MAEIKGKVIFDKELCTGCLACMTACIDARCPAENAEGVSMRRIRKVTDEKARFQKNICTGCLHCGLCISQCGQGALYRDEETGLLLRRREWCVRCGMCAQFCPEQAIFFDKDKKAEKCDGCIEYQREGRLPACVKACPVHALKIEKQ